MPRFVLQGQKEKEKYYLLHTSKTIKYRKLMLLCSLGSIFGFKICNQDVTQTYIQGHPVTGDVCVQPAPELNLV